MTGEFVNGTMEIIRELKFEGKERLLTSCL